MQSDDADIYGDYEDLLDEESGPETVQQHAEPRPAPSPEELRAGMARIADKLGNLSG